MSDAINRYFILHKPYNMVSQFVSADKLRLLTEIDFDFPEGIHAIGRLDSQSEGLLILTTNKKVTKLLFESKVPHTRTYWVQVLKKVSEETLQQLRSGISIRIRGGEMWMTSPCEAEIIETPALLYANEHAIADFIPHTWLQLTLTEGKFHQVRKMVFAAGHRCRKLIRISIEDLMLGGLPPGHIKEIAEADFFRYLKIKDFNGS